VPFSTPDDDVLSWWLAVVTVTDVLPCSGGVSLSPPVLLGEGVPDKASTAHITIPANIAGTSSTHLSICINNLLSTPRATVYTIEPHNLSLSKNKFFCYVLG
jgi:hypothetical protein